MKKVRYMISAVDSKGKAITKGTRNKWRGNGLKKKFLKRYGNYKFSLCTEKGEPFITFCNRRED